MIMNLMNMNLTFTERSHLCKNPIGRDLLQLMDKKKSNLALAVDVPTKKELLYLAEKLGPHICILKTHIDIIDDFDQDLIIKLQELAHKLDFFIFEDRKFADIGNTVKMQYEGGIYKIAQWSHITNAHPLPGPGIIQGLKEVGKPLGRGLLLLAEMSSEGALTDETYRQASAKMALEHPDFVIGFISQQKIVNNPAFIHMTPGVSLSQNGDFLGQQYNTPQRVIGERGNDVMIVGRSITHAKDPLEVAIQYREAGWSAYIEKL
jgi:orotidine 5'-phosphate decarboxylase subfamily 1